MASIPIVIGGAVVNAASFIGGNYLACYLSGGDKAAQEEKVRHDKALEAYQVVYAKYEKDRKKLLNWIATNDQIKDQAKQNLLTPTTLSSSTIKLTHMSKYQYPKSLSSLTSINPASSKNNANSCLLAQVPLLLGTQPFDSFEKDIIFLYIYIWRSKKLLSVFFAGVHSFIFGMIAIVLFSPLSKML